MNYQFLFFSLCMILLCILAYEKCYVSAYIFINVSFWGYLSLLPLLSFTLGSKAIRSRLSSRFPTRRDWNRLEHRATSFLFYFLLIKKWEKPLLFRNRIASFFCSALWVTFCSIFYRHFCHRYKYRWSIEEGAFRW